MIAPTCFGIILPSSGSVPSAFSEMLNWGAVDRISWMGVLCLVTLCVAISAPRPGRFLPPWKTRYPLYRRLGGPQGRSGHVRKISPPPGFDPRTVQPVASSYTDWTTRPTCVVVYTRVSLTSYVFLVYSFLVVSIRQNNWRNVRLLLNNFKAKAHYIRHTWIYFAALMGL
jgi:hypothetical protein